MSSEPDVKVTSEPLRGEHPVVLMGFPGNGLVGSIALQYLVEQLDFDLIGNITSKYFPPVAMMANGVINVPVRIYEKDNVVAIVADIPIHPMICYEVANGIMDWITPYQPREVITIAGIVTNEPEKRVFGVATQKAMLERIQDHTVVLPMGSISGIAGSILTECKIREIPGFGFLGETVNTPDPRSSAATLAVLNTLYGFEVDIDPLLEQAADIEATMHKLAEEVQRTEPVQQKKEYLPMYG